MFVRLLTDYGQVKKNLLSIAETVIITVYRKRRGCPLVRGPAAFCADERLIFRYGKYRKIRRRACISGDGFVCRTGGLHAGPDGADLFNKFHFADAAELFEARVHAGEGVFKNKVFCHDRFLSKAS